jgi:hypothetical protein
VVPNRGHKETALVRGAARAVMGVPAGADGTSLKRASSKTVPRWNFPTLNMLVVVCTREGSD